MGGPARQRRADHDTGEKCELTEHPPDGGLPVRCYPSGAQLRRVYEVIWNSSLDPGNFKRHVRESGAFEQRAPQRPPKAGQGARPERGRPASLWAARRTEAGRPATAARTLARPGGSSQAGALLPAGNRR